MQEYEFRIGMHEDCTGVDMPVAEWTTQGAGMFLNGTVAICMSTKSWNEAPEDKL